MLLVVRVEDFAEALVERFGVMERESLESIMEGDYPQVCRVRGAVDALRLCGDEVQRLLVELVGRDEEDMRDG